MKILVTGATGLLGGNLVRHLWRKGGLKKAIRELGIPQSPIEGAVPRAIGWFRKHGYL